MGHDIQNINPNSVAEILGSAERVTVSAEETTVINGGGDQESVKARVDEIKSQIENQDNESEKLILKERLSKLEGGVAIIKVGGYTDIEIKEKRDRIDDALGATQAAVEEGILPGGGIALYRAAIEISAEIEKSFSNDFVGDEKVGASILLESCKDPFNTIILNAGKNPEVISKDLKDEYTSGYNSRTGEYVDMLKSGIIDPAKVTRAAIENAASISGLMITTECVLMEKAIVKPAEK
jgi:chaperonin GroEL